MNAAEDVGARDDTGFTEAGVTVGAGETVETVERAGTRRPKVVIIGPTPPPYHGMTTVTLTLLRSEILNDRYEVLHLDTADRRSQENMGRLDLTNVTLALRHAAGLARIVVKERPDVVYVQVSQNAWAYLRDAVFIVVARALGARVLTHLNGAGFRNFYEGTNPFMRWLIRATSRRLDGAAVLSGRLRHLYQGLVPDDRIHVLPNGIVDPLPDAPRPEPSGRRGDGDDAVVITYLSTLIRSKGFPLLMRAAARLRDDGLNVRLVCAGAWFTPADRAEGERLVGELDLAGTVELPGVVTGPAKMELLRRSDIFALPTSYPPEGQPFVILEAMAAGLPIVSTARGAIPDMVEPSENGVLVPEGDVDALTEALRRLARDPAERARMAAASRRIFETRFTDEQCARGLVDLLDAVRAT